MALEDIAGSVLNAVGELVGRILNPALLVLGFSEIKAEQIEKAIVLSIGASFVLALFYITFKYS